MTKQEFARRRNWMKARLISFKFDATCLTDTEKLQIADAKTIIEHMLSKWDESSKRLGMKLERYNLYVTNAGIETLWKEKVPYSTINFLIKGLNKNQYRIEKVL